jgi:hypothetical protein
VAVTAVALASLVGGSWLVVSAATAPAPSAGSAALRIEAGQDPGPRAHPSGTPVRTATTVTRSADAGPAAGGPAAQPLAAAPTSSPPSDPPSTAPTTVAQPTTPAVAPAAAAPAPVSSVPSTVATEPTTVAASPPASPVFAAALPRAAPSRPGAVAPPPGTPALAQAAMALIRAIDGQSGGGRPVRATADNVTLLERWMANEGGLWANNPLNTSLDAGDYPHEFTASGQDTGQAIFPTMALGIAATATTLLSNPAYGQIVDLLRTGRASCLSFARAVIRSPWASSHYEYNTARFCGGVPAPARPHSPRHRAR